MMDHITSRTSQAFSQSRIFLKLLSTQIIPAFPPTDRVFADHLRQRIEQREILDEDFVRDLDAFSFVFERLIADGTSVGWKADEHHVEGGYEFKQLNDRAKALGSAVAVLRDLRTAITETLDAKMAMAAELRSSQN